MSAVAAFNLILFLMAVALLLELLAGRLRMPPAGAFILGGGVLALIPGVPAIEFDPDLVLVPAALADVERLFHLVARRAGRS